MSTLTMKRNLQESQTGIAPDKHADDREKAHRVCNDRVRKGPNDVRLVLQRDEIPLEENTWTSKVDSSVRYVATQTTEAIELNIYHRPLIL